MKYIFILFLFVVNMVSCIGDPECSSHIGIENQSSKNILVTSLWRGIDTVNVVMMGNVSDFIFGDCEYLYDFAVLDMTTLDTLFNFGGILLLENDTVSFSDNICVGDMACIEFMGYETYPDGTHSRHNYSLVLTDSVFGRWQQNHE